MISSVKLEIAFQILQEMLLQKIQLIDQDDFLGRIKVVLRDSTIIYIRYNNYSGYSYNVFFSQEENDRIRFDNFDDQWDVETKPHHFHPRNSKEGFESPMIGDPKHDIIILINLLTNQKLREKSLRFKG